MVVVGVYLISPPVALIVAGFIVGGMGSALPVRPQPSPKAPEQNNGGTPDSKRD